MPGFLERLHTLWAALQLRLRGGAPGLFYIGGSDTMPAPLDRAAEQQAMTRQGLAEVEQNCRLTQRYLECLRQEFEKIAR